MFGQIIVFEPPIEEKTKAKIFITENTKAQLKNSETGISGEAKFYKILDMASDVVAMLEKRAKDAGIAISEFPMIGDWITVWGSSGMRFKIDGEELITISVNDIIGKRLYEPTLVEEIENNS